MYSYGMAMRMVRFWQLFFEVLAMYRRNFAAPMANALRSFMYAEASKSPATIRDYFSLALLNLNLWNKSQASSQAAVSKYLDALFSQANKLSVEEAEKFWDRQIEILDALLFQYPQDIKEIGSEYGFHFENGGYELIPEASTERFLIYRVLPTNVCEIDMKGKPILIVPPIVLGENILAFLVGENMSYVHKFSNKGVPTYVRVLKDISNRAVRIMTGEDDVTDTAHICAYLKRIHGKKVTLNGICQGGFMCLLGILSGKLDGIVDKLITCVAPIDGSRGGTIKEYMKHLGGRYVDLNHSIKFIDGDPVVDGKILSWVFKLRTIEKDNPDVTMCRDILLLQKNADMKKAPAKALAINYWMTYDQRDLPLAIVELSFPLYVHGIAPDGTLPVQLFGQALNIKTINELGVEYLICVAEKDDLVPLVAAMAPLDYIKAELSVFEKGHIDMLIAPQFKPTRPEYRTPVQFHLAGEVEVVNSDFSIPVLVSAHSSVAA